MARIKKFLSNPINWVWILGGISLVFGILWNIFNAHWLYIAAIIPWVPISLFVVVSIIFAWIINPIRALIRHIKNKKDDADDI